VAAQGLSPLQRRILELLAGVEPPWTLTGGAALVGFHLGHRTTRDLDLFWHGNDRLEACIRRLEAAGLTVESVQRHPAFERLLVSDGDEREVAEPVEAVEAPQRLGIGDTTVLVDTAHEILVNKLCALLGRAELRDLVDVQALLDHGGDLARAVADAPRKDGGFSAVTLAWVLRGMSLDALAAATGLGEAERGAPARARENLVAQLVQDSPP